MVGAPIATACIARSLTSLALQDVHIADVLQVSEVLRHLTGLQKLQWNVTNFAGDGSPRHACTACIPTLQGAEFLAHMPKLNFLELALHLKDDSEFDGVGQLLGALTGLSHLCLVLKSLSESGVMQLRRHLTTLKHLQTLRPGVPVRRVNPSDVEIRSRDKRLLQWRPDVELLCASEHAEEQSNPMMYPYTLSQKMLDHALGLRVPIRDLKVAFPED